MNNRIFLALKGAAMGIAETIPGVSGGTIAFITGIYEELLDTIKAFNPSLITTFKNDGLAAVWKAINGSFLLTLIGGMVIGLGIGIVGVEHFLATYPPIVWAFFFGLILASIIYVGKQITTWNAAVIINFIIGAAIAFGVTQLPVGQANGQLWFVFLCGALGVSALILPGISGSFILLILGMYQFILHETFKDGVISNQDPKAILIMAVFGLGMLFGLATFSRVVSYAFKNYKNPTLALLAGFMLGAINKLWPWRIPTKIMNEEGELLNFLPGMDVDKVIKEVSVLPSKYAETLGEPTFLVPAIASVVIGFALVLVLDSQTKTEL